MAEQGDIVIVIGLLDPQGRNPKDRACVLLSPPERIEASRIDRVIGHVPNKHLLQVASVLRGLRDGGAESIGSDSTVPSSLETVSPMIGWFALLVDL